MSKKNSPKIYPLYSVLRYFIKLGTWLYFGKVDTTNAKNYKGGLIYALNHQNGLLDPIVVAVDIDRQVSFVARSDIFKSSFANSFFRGVKMLPIYRQRDKVNTLEKNEETFQVMTDRLTINDSLVIFPEGNQAEKRKIRSLKKGFARMAFQTMEKTNWSTELNVIPIGINYEDTQKVGSDVLINFGELIDVRNYKELYKQDEAEALKEITLDLKAKLKDVCIHIENEEHYDSIDTLRYMFREDLISKYKIRGSRQEQEFKADKRSIKFFESLLEENSTALNPVQEQIMEYGETIEKYKLNNSSFNKSRKSAVSILMNILGFIFAAPVYWYGLLVNVIPFKLTGYITRSRVSDPMFHPTVNFTIGSFLYSIWWIILAIVIWVLTSGWLALLFFLTIPIFAKFSFWIYERMKNRAAEIRYSGLRNNSDVQRAQEIRQNLIDSYLEKI